MSTVTAVAPLMYDAELGDLVPRAGYALQAANGETLALFDEWAEADEWIERARLAYHEAWDCGHPLAPRWLNQRLPLTVRAVTEEQWEDILADGTPWLQQEP